MTSSLNVVLFGETGVGKSSVINLIAGRQIAQTSPGIVGCTLSSQSYSVPINGRTIRLWDTAGLNEPRIGPGNYLGAIEQANNLIQQLTSQGGVDLLLFCIRGGRVTATMQSNYRLFYEVLCRSQVPIALVVTHLEWETDLEDWWKREAGNLEKYDIRATGHACVIGLQNHRKYPEARANIARLLEGYNSDGRFNMPPQGWFIQFLRLLGPFFPLYKESKRKDIVGVLTRRCGLDLDMAKDLAYRLGGAEPVDTNTPHLIHSPTFNVVLFGESGVGKSSVVNLIAQNPIAKVSGGVDGCTMESTQYNILLDGMNFALFDTVGLREPQFGMSHYMAAIEKAYELIVKLSAQGGIHLLLFCMRAGRITATMQRNYRLFSECLCSKDVPIVLVFTGLESELELEDWWTRERAYIEHSGLKSDGHACVTAVQDGRPEQQFKYKESQRKIRELLKHCTLKNRSFSPEPKSWFVRLAGKMWFFITKRTKPTRRDVMKVLTQRVRMDNDTAKKIADMMEREPQRSIDDVWNM